MTSVILGIDSDNETSGTMEVKCFSPCGFLQSLNPLHDHVT